MGHYVTCSVCGKIFNRDVVQAVKSGSRRYAHYDCYPDGELVPLVKKEDIIKNKIKEEQAERDEEEIGLRKLTDYIQKLYGKDANWPMIMKQIQTYKNDYGYTYSGMLKSLIYFYDIKGNPMKLVKGVGIIPYAYKDAYNYYYALFMANSQNEQKDLQKITSQVREITIKPPSISKPKRFFNLDEDDEILNKGENNE